MLPRRSLRRLLFPLLVLSLVSLFATTARAAQYFVAPDGDDGNSGATKSAPLKTFSAALGKLAPGDTLVLLDGTYTFDKNGAFRATCGRNTSNGKKGARITVRAANERRAWIKGDGSRDPVHLTYCSYWDVEGLRVSSADQNGGSKKTFKINRSDHIRVRRLLIHDVNRYQNSTGLQLTRTHHSLIEEVEVYYFHRHGISAYQSDHITLRRSYIDGRGATDVSGGWGSHRCCTDGGDEAISYYYTSNSIVENVVTVDSEAMSVISGFDTVLGNPGGRNNQLLGSISLRDQRPSFFQSRIKNSNSKSAKDIRVKDYLVVGSHSAPMVIRGPETFSLEGATFYDTEVRPIHVLASPGGEERGRKALLSRL